VQEKPATPGAATTGWSWPAASRPVGAAWRSPLSERRDVTARRLFAFLGRVGGITEEAGKFINGIEKANKRQRLFQLISRQIGVFCGTQLTNYSVIPECIKKIFFLV
jgi:hypothetical protein